MGRWAPVPGYEGYYEVSDDGRVRSVDRVLTDGRRRKGRPMRARPVNQWGHRTVGLSRGNKVTRVLVHHLVLSAFDQPRPEGSVARHLNGNPADNRIENLRWGTHAENMQDMVAHGTNWQTRKTHCPRGHPLERWNLDNSQFRKGYRSCASCMYAHNVTHLHPDRVSRFQEIGDAKLEKLRAVFYIEREIEKRKEAL